MGLEGIYRRLKKTARMLYWCWLSCKDPFPSSDMKDKWVVDVWNEARMRTEAPPNLSPKGEEVCLFSVTCGLASLEFQFTCSSMKFVTYIKTKIQRAVVSSYEFDTSRTPYSISFNARHAQALLTRMTFINGVRLIPSPFASN
jgi:hypothetical protein